MPTSEIPFFIGDVVEYVADPKVWGRVVGYGTVDNRPDPTSTDDRTHAVVIVSLDTLAHIGPTALTHVAFTADVLKPFYM